MDLTGTALRGYELKAQIGAGGFGAVYRAYQPAVRRDVAIKVILPIYANQADFIRDFESEVQLVARLEHPNIIPLYDYWREPDGAYFVMRWVRGGSLRQALARQRWTPAMTVRLLDQIAAALDYAHRNGIVHRDLKPDNILLDEDANAYLADFGIAKLIADLQDEEATNVLVGSPAYAAPEQVLGEPVSIQTDIYSLGIVLFEMLSGRRPFEAESATDILIKHVREVLPTLQGTNLTADLDGVIRRAAAKKPHIRYPDALALAVDFRRAAAVAMGGESALTDAPLPRTDATSQRPNLSPPSLSEQTTILESPERTLITPLGYEEDGDSTRPATSREAEQTDMRTFVLLTPTNPYKGLRAFQEADASDFFGRDEVITALTARLSDADAEGRFLALVGASGSGKSSLARAGLIPALRRGVLPASERWFYTDMIPGSDPYNELADALLRVAVNPPPDLPAALLEGDRALVEIVNAVLPDADSDLVILIDQFEEVFTVCPDELRRAAFLRALQTAAHDPASRLRIVITIRADFYDRPLQYPLFGDLLRRTTEIILPLHGEALAMAITAPALRAGLTLESGLTETILSSVQAQPGTLPLMQYALTELFERRTGTRLTLAAYQASGGVAGALARRADELYEALDQARRALAQSIFLRLVMLGEGAEDTRRRADRAELTALSENPTDIEAILDGYGTFRLLSFDRDPATRAPTVEVAHEALIREWGTLRGWLDAGRDDVRTQRRLIAAVDEWEAKGDASYLAAGARLEQFETWAQTTKLGLTTRERRFLEESQREQAEHRARDARIARRVQNFQRTAILLGGVVVLAVIAIILAARQAAEATAQVALAAETLTPVPQTLTPVQLTLVAGERLITEGRSTATAVALARAEQEALLAGLRLAGIAGDILRDPAGSPELAALLAVRSMQHAYSPQGDGVLVGALDQLFIKAIATPHDGAVSSLAFDADYISGGQDGVVYIRQQERHEALPNSEGVTDIAVSGGAAPFLLVTANSGAVYLTHLAAVQPFIELGRHEGAVLAAAITTDGSLAATGGVDGLIRLWDTEKQREIGTLEGDAFGILSLAFSPDGKTLLSGGVGGEIIVWEVATQTKHAVLRQFENPILSLRMDTTGKRVLAASGNEAYLFRLADPLGGTVFSGHSDLVNVALFDPTERAILTASADKTIRLYDLESGIEQRRLLGHSDAVLDIVVEGAEVFSASADGTIRTWEYTHPSALETAAAVISVGGGVDETGILRPRFASGTTVWEWTGRADRPPLSRDLSVPVVALSADGRYALSSEGDRLTMFDLGDLGETAPNVVQTFTLPSQAQIASIAIGRRYLLVGSADQSAFLWEIASGRLLVTLPDQGDWVSGVALSSAENFLATVTLSGMLRLYEVSPDSSDPLRPRFAIQTESAALWAVALSPDGKTTAVGDEAGRIRLYAAKDGLMEREILAHPAQVNTLTFSGDSAFLISGGADKTAAVFRLSDGRLIRRLSGHTEEILSVVTSPDGGHILTGSRDRTARLWATTPEGALREACQRLPRDFTAAERLAYGIPPQPTCEKR